MAQDDWFHKTTWSDSDEQDFFARLKRSRSSYHKAQYLRIQAHALAQTNKESLVLASLELLRRIFEEFPEPSQLTAAHLQAARCYELLGKTELALYHFRLSLLAKSKYPNSDSGTALEYAWFIVVHNLTEHFGAAINALQSARLDFPVQIFQASAVRAFIAHENGDRDAQRFAIEALEAAALNKSQFRNHSALGLVGEKYRSQVERLRVIAAA